MSFSSLGLSEPLLRAVKQKGYATPSAIQQQAIPLILSGSDLLAAAQTGTGKTASFALPLLQQLANGNKAQAGHIRALILTPTRELAAQVAASVTTYGQNLSLSSGAVFGGVNIRPQINKLRKGTDVLVATPGRLMDIYQQKSINFSQVQILVLDEADRMLDMGFIHEIRKIIALLPQTRQTLLFSATLSGDIRKLAKGMLNKPQQIAVNPQNIAAPQVRHCVYEVDKGKKAGLLSHLLRENNWHQALVFTRTKHGANNLAQKLARDNITTAIIHGNKSQGVRTRALADFKKNKVQALVATDIAARGLDITELPHVINFELPNVPEDYIHRIGRTGRAGCTGDAVSLVSADESKFLAAIENLLRQKLPREIAPDFAPLNKVPHAPLPKRPSNSAGGRKRNYAASNKRTRNNSGNGNPQNNKRPQSTGRPQNSSKPPDFDSSYS